MFRYLLKVTCAIFLLPLFSSTTAAQKKWDGEGGDQQWNNPLNWEDDIEPGAVDDILLDNSIVSIDYVIYLPGGVSVVAVKTLTITPSPGKNITVVLPLSNTSIPAFISSGPGYGLTLNNGAIFKNSSGASSGTPLNIADSFRINSGGRYIHNTQRGHSSNVTVLSKAPGTEGGIFEFDIPAVSSTISLSDRIYGKLKFSAVAAGGTVNYTAAGTKRFIINSDLEMGSGVTLSLNFSDTCLVKRDFIQLGGVLNLGTSSRRLILSIEKNLVQSLGGLITETGTSNPELILSGDELQYVQMEGSILNNITFTMNGNGGARLQAPLSLSYKLKLVKGKIASSSAILLRLLPACVIEADSISMQSFISGPMRKEGIVTGNFLFPVGKDNMMRWLNLKNATGNFTVEYQKSDPHSLSLNMSAGIDHISRLEHWTVEADSSPAPAAEVELSFYDPNSGGVTDLANLRVGQLIDSTWYNAGNIGVSGTAGAMGSVTSESVGSLSLVNKFFTLASGVPGENPLPERRVDITAHKIRSGALLKWSIDESTEPDYFELQGSTGNRNYLTIQKIPAQTKKTSYEYIDRNFWENDHFYRVKIVKKDGIAFYSKTIQVIEKREFVQITRLFPNITNNTISLNLSSVKNQPMIFYIMDMKGTIVKKIPYTMLTGISTVNLYVNHLQAGLYQIFGLSSISHTNIFRFYKY